MICLHRRTILKKAGPNSDPNLLTYSFHGAPTSRASHVEHSNTVLELPVQVGTSPISIGNRQLYTSQEFAAWQRANLKTASTRSPAVNGNTSIPLESYPASACGDCWVKRADPALPRVMLASA